MVSDPFCLHRIEGPIEQIFGSDEGFALFLNGMGFSSFRYRHFIFYFLRDAPLPFLIFCRYSPPLGICILTTRNICSASLTSWGQPSRAPFGENKSNYAFFDHIARLNDKLTRYTLNNIARILLKISFPLIFTSYHTLIEIGMLF